VGGFCGGGDLVTDTYTGPDRRAAPLTPPGAFPWWVLPGLAFFALVAFAAVAAASFMTNDATLRTQTANTWSNIAIAVVAYWFGSSAGSAKKDDAAAADSAKKTEALAGSAPAAPLTVSQTIDAGPPASATATATADPHPTTTTPAAGQQPKVETPPP